MGVDLRCHLQERRVLPLVQKLEFMAQVCDGLAFAHSKGIAHGNIKPSNLFVVAGKDARILDLGLAKWLASVLAAEGKHPTLVPNYLAPEQVLGQPFDARSDLFSLAVVLYELLVQKYPFEAAENLIPREIVHSEPEPLRKLDATLPEELELLVIRALKKDPRERLATAEEFAAGLNGIVQKLRDAEDAAASVVAQPPSTPAPIPAASPEVPKPVPAPVAPPAAAAVTPPAAAAIPVPPPAAAAVPIAASTKPAPSAIPVAPEAPKPAPVPPRVPPAVSPAKPAGQWLVARQMLGGLAEVSNFIQSRKRPLMIAVAALLAFFIVGTLVSRQHLHASQSKSPAPAAAAVKNSVEETKANPAPPPAVIHPAEPPAASSVPSPAPTPEQILRSKVKPLWESGEYGKAMALVSEILTDSPDNAEALTWKRKIRAAQEAEAAIK